MTETILTYPTFLLGFGGGIYHISHESITRDGEATIDHDARLERNTDRQRHRDEEPTRRADGDPNALHHACCNLEDEFNMVGNQLV